MRVLTITQEYPPVGGGAASVSRQIAARLSTLGHEVVVLTMGFAGSAEYEESDGVRIFRTPAKRAHADRCTVPEMARFVISAIRTIRRHPEWAETSVCHSHFIVPGGLIALYLKWSAQVPYVITCHGSDVIGYNRRFRFVYPFVATVWRRVVRQADVVTVASQFLAERVARRKHDASVAVIPNMVETERFRPLEKTRSILVVGRLVPSKRVGDLLDALAGLDIPEWKIDIVGDGPMAAALRRQASRSGLVDRVRFHGWIPNDSPSLRELYGRAFLFVSTSYLENMSVAQLEALSAGCRVIATNVGGSTEVPGTKFFKPGDVRALRDLILSELADFRPATTPAGRAPQHRADDYASLLVAHARTH
jgi:glycosyltransferase involved in cell wall biosynthesis